MERAFQFAWIAFFAAVGFHFLYLTVYHLAEHYGLLGYFNNQTGFLLFCLALFACLGGGIGYLFYLREERIDEIENWEESHLIDKK
ncbi:MAG: hypothetical protein KDD28_15265 [Phaeodactylibacter sp.]|nr:hypothetical protein [Phaeodactylibacter sp.]